MAAAVVFESSLQGFLFSFLSRSSSFLTHSFSRTWLAARIRRIPDGMFFRSSRRRAALSATCCLSAPISPRFFQRNLTLRGYLPSIGLIFSPCRRIPSCRLVYHQQVLNCAFLPGGLLFSPCGTGHPGPLPPFPVLFHGLFCGVIPTCGVFSSQLIA